MSPSIDQAVKIVRKALDTAPDDLNTFLTEECEGDTALRQLVETMLRQASGIVDNEQQTGDALDPLLGQRLGAFRVVERVGRGGMGVVYRGEREDAGFAQVVALKLIRKGLDFDEVQARFLRERRILSRLSHPNLARFIDGGVAPDGRPWFALEFVQGQPLLAWCDDHRLDVRARVKLFLDVCAAVQYAHTQLVVHRDLKPGNVLVDADGAPRLLDFGISRLLEGDEGEATLTVEGKRFAFTPEYAAPEQFGGEAGIAADVYSLGTILYRLIAGVLPYPIDRRDLAEAERIVRTTPPQPLAQAIQRTDAADSAEKRLEARSTSLRTYRSTVRGDLSRILDKALAKEPERRYANVQSFAEDLQHWLDGVPVRASGNAFGYRLRKFVGRNRAATALAALALLLLLGGVAGMLWKTRQALDAAARANAMQSYLLSLFENAVPEMPTEQVPDTRTLLERGAQRARTEFSQQPRVQAEMLTTLGRIYNQLELDKDAEPLLEEALKLYRAAGKADDADVAGTLLELARVHEKRRQYAPAAARLREALAAAGTKDSAREAAIHQTLGRVLAADGKLDDGVREANRAIDLYRASEHPPGPRTAEALNDLGFVLFNGNRCAEALAPYNEALTLLRSIYGEVHAEIGVTLSNIGDCQRRLGQLAEAEATLRKAADVDAHVYTQPSPRQAIHLNNLAIVRLTRGDAVEGERLMREVLRLREAVFGPNDPMVARALINLAGALTLEAHFDDATAMLRRALEISENSPGDWSSSIAYTHLALARSLIGAQRWSEAEVEARRAIELHGKRDNGRGPDSVAAHVALGEVLWRSGHAAQARTLLEDTLATGLDALPKDHPRLAECHIALADAELALAQYAQARAHYEEGLRMGLATLGAKHATVVNARAGLAEALRGLGENTLADEQAKQAYDASRELAAATPARRRAERVYASVH